jgi:cytochrome P450
MSILQRHGFAMSRTMVNEGEPNHMEQRRLLMDASLPERLVVYEPMVRKPIRQHQKHPQVVPMSDLPSATAPTRTWPRCGSASTRARVSTPAAPTG